MISHATPKRRSPKQVASQKRATETRKQRGDHRAKNAIGIIKSDESYSIEAFISLLGTTRSGLTAMRRRGLKARLDGQKRVLILGSDYIDYLKNQPVAELDAPAESVEE